MALPIRQQVTYWGIATAVFLFVLWALGNVILPFLVGGAIAYFLDPVADRLEKMGLSRVLATVIIFVFLLGVVTLSLLVIIPLLIQQTNGLIQSAPDLFNQLRNWLSERFPDVMAEGSPVRQSLVSIGETIQSRGGELLQQLLSSAAGVVNLLVFLVVVPVVAFYMLLDWDRLIARMDDLLPRDHADTIRMLAGQIDRTLASFIRGQGTVCLILGTFYAVALMVVGLQFGLVVGLVAGLLTFIPYVGALVGGGLSVGLALFQFWGDWWLIVAVAAIFQVGQMVEGNILTPKLVGSSVGLHPVWLIFALSAFGTLFGFAGMLVAVPVAAAIGVLVRFVIDQYKDGLLYKGQSDREHEGHGDDA
ncbi:AI-2E family transporter [Roseicyclus mahoneyensis]|uniref:Putative PurR-regulated permease PerM n=1 Tax=Roseicyclus mahoneyensis TaxID=164332 RepID=A0A316GLA5_9RHOB|nr:AI-2E family transporter [Roseicyclus mahoneyensis]PWK60978.1 putative PurR-regulated permease PerM [Roseicyclus mahoneyensis]